MRQPPAGAQRLLRCVVRICQNGQKETLRERRLAQTTACPRGGKLAVCETTALFPASLKIGKEGVVLLSHFLAVGLSATVVLGVDVEALGIAGISNRGADGTLDAAVEEVVPVGLAEEGVFPNARGATANVAEAAGTVDGAEGPDDVLGFVRDWGFLRKHDGLFQDSSML